MSMNPYLSKVQERSEQEHKELIVTANKGAEANKKLVQKYSDVTEVVTEDGSVYSVGVLNTGKYKVKDKG
jgi:hypothetical protein